MGFLDRVLDELSDIEVRDVVPQGTFLESIVNPRGPIFKEGAALDTSQIQDIRARNIHDLVRNWFDLLRSDETKTIGGIGKRDLALSKFWEGTRYQGSSPFYTSTRKNRERGYLNYLIENGLRPETASTAEYDPRQIKSEWADTFTRAIAERVRQRNIDNYNRAFVPDMLRKQDRQDRLEWITGNEYRHQRDIGRERASGRAKDEFKRTKKS